VEDLGYIELVEDRSHSDKSYLLFGMVEALKMLLRNTRFIGDIMDKAFNAEKLYPGEIHTYDPQNNNLKIVDSCFLRGMARYAQDERHDWEAYPIVAMSPLHLPNMERTTTQFHLVGFREKK
jgi:hypothetical protein